MNKELPIKIEVFPYRLNQGNFEFLLVKRSPEDGNFWQPVTGTLEFDESVLQCLLRELKEEAGLNCTKEDLTPEVYRFAWQKKDYTVVELVYGIKVTSDQEIKLSHEHSDYKWASTEQVLDILEKENNKAAYRKLCEFIKIEV